MAVRLALLLLWTSIFVQVQSSHELSPQYYHRSCPLVHEIVRDTVAEAVYMDPRMAASLLRLHFHDCFVLGCDGSLLLDSRGEIVSEKEALPNLNSLRGFEVVDVLKARLEEACPQTVSCADILAIAARDAVNLRGGPNWEVQLGRRDSLRASISAADQMLPAPNFTLDMLVHNFRCHGLDVVDLVSLSGSHTIGRSRCKSFRKRLYAGDHEPVESTNKVDHWSSDRRQSDFFRSLRTVCPPSGRDNLLIPLDVMTSRKFDNQYYINLISGNALLKSDDELVRGRPEGSIAALVRAYAQDQQAFFRDFARSMIKMGNINVITGEEGEIRRHCRCVNSE